jgi:hypothetical protein
VALARLANLLTIQVSRRRRILAIQAHGPVPPSARIQADGVHRAATTPLLASVSTPRLLAGGQHLYFRIYGVRGGREGGRGLKDVWNSRGHFELDGDIGGRSGCGEPRRVIQQYLVRATLDQ